MLTKFTVVSLLLISSLVPAAYGADIGFELKITGGKTDKPSPPPPPSPGPAIIIETPPLLLIPPVLGFQVAVGIPYDLFVISGKYYVFHNGSWYVGPSYKGPWGAIKHKKLPPGLQKHKIERLRTFRDEEHKKHKAKKGHDDDNEKGRGKGKKHKD